MPVPAKAESWQPSTSAALPLGQGQGLCRVHLWGLLRLFLLARLFSSLLVCVDFSFPSSALSYTHTYLYACAHCFILTWMTEIRKQKDLRKGKQVRFGAHLPMKARRESCGDRRYKGHVVSRESGHTVVSATTEANTEPRKRRAVSYLVSGDLTASTVKRIS